MAHVSIILPTFNRDQFLSECIDAISGQHYTDWELIVVDDGSTDGTRELVPQLAATVSQRVRYIYQHNQGPYGARNTGLEHATGKYVAFYDSDDLWLPHHLDEGVKALELNRDVDWVYSATRMIDLDTGDVMSPNTFYDAGAPRQFLELPNTEVRSGIHLLAQEEGIRVALEDALFAGLQTSVMRRGLFDRIRLPAFRVGEDQVFTILAMKAGFRLAYIDSVHVDYRVHAGGISAAGHSKPDIHTIQACVELMRAFEWLADAVDLTRQERQLLMERVSKVAFWGVAYRMQQCGMHDEAHGMFLKAIGHSPWHPMRWKTFAVSYLKRYASYVSRYAHRVLRDHRVG